MANYKGTGILFIKKYLQAKSPEAEKQFLDLLTDEDKKIYSKCLAFSWIPLEKATLFYEKMAQIIYPGDMQGMEKIGKELAKDNLRGIYSFLLKFVTIPYAVKQAAQFWRTYHQAGEASAIADEQKKQVVFIVNQYLDIPELFCFLLQGYISGIIEMTGARMVNVEKSEMIVNGRQWKATWF